MGGDYTYTYIKCIFIPQNACLFVYVLYASQGLGAAPRLLCVLEQNSVKRDEVSPQGGNRYDGNSKFK